MTKNAFDLLVKDREEEAKLHRKPPHNLLAEQMVLGHILTNNENINKVNEFLLPEHFYEPVHGRIFETILLFNGRGLTASIVTLKNQFDKDEDLKAIGGSEYLVYLCQMATTIVNIADYARNIYDLALRRSLISIGEEVVNDAFEKEIELTAAEQIENAESKLFKLASEGNDLNKGFLSIRSSLAEAITRAQRAYQNKEKVTGISTGFIDLDGLLGGFQNSDLVILAARPSMGKTALAVNLAMNAAEFLKDKHLKENPDDIKNIPSVGVFSLEMSAEQLSTRILSMESKINTSDIRSGKLDEEKFGEVFRASQKLEKMPVFIDDTPSLTISAVRTRARRLKRKHNLSILFIDYLQLLRGFSKNSESSRVQEISEITQGLKAIAKELDIPVIALSQLSRAVETRPDKRPLLSDLRESGSIEQDADIVLFIYREEYYLLRQKPSEDKAEDMIKWQQRMDVSGNVSEILVAKHRNGPVGNISLYFNSALTRFDNLSKDHDQIVKKENYVSMEKKNIK